MAKLEIDVNVLPKSIDNAITNVFDDITKQIGKVLVDSFYLKFGSKSYLAEKRRLLEKYGLIEFEKLLKTIIENIDPEKLVSPDFQTIHLALNNAEFCLSSETLRGMFANLIASSCNSDTTDFVHPSFSEIIKQMSPFDAKFLQYFVTTKPEMVISYEFIHSTSHESYTRLNYIIDEYPDFDEIIKVSLAFSSLSRLGILAIHDDAMAFMLSDTQFEKSSFYLNCEAERIAQGDYKNSRLLGKTAIITPLGQSFIKSCLPG